MTKTRFALAAATAAIALAPAMSLAKAAQTDIDGTVTASGSPVKHATVEVTCDGTTKTTHTNASGAYLVTFAAKKCPAGSTVTVDASKGGVGSGSNSGTVSPYDTDKLNVGIVNVAIPEMGYATGALALVGATGAVVALRRRELDRA